MNTRALAKHRCSLLLLFSAAIDRNIAGEGPAVCESDAAFEASSALLPARCRSMILFGPLF